MLRTLAAGTVGLLLGVTAATYARRRIASLLWWLFGNGKA